MNLTVILFQNLPDAFLSQGFVRIKAAGITECFGVFMIVWIIFAGNFYRDEHFEHLKFLEIYRMKYDSKIALI